MIILLTVYFTVNLTFHFLGIGICFFFLSSIVAVGLYFTRKRAIATGIAMSGSGLGVIVYPYLTQLLLDMYDWRNTLLIIAALCLNAVVCGALFRPLTRRNIDKSTCKCLEENSLSDSDERRSMLSFRCKNEDSVSPTKIYNSTSGIGEELKSFLDTNINDNIDKRQFFSEQHLSSIKPTDFRKTEYHSFLSPRLRSDVYYSGSVNILPSYNCKLKFEIGLEDETEKAKETNDSLFLSCIQMFRQLRFTLLLCCMVMWTCKYNPNCFVNALLGIENFSLYHKKKNRRKKLPKRCNFGTLHVRRIYLLIYIYSSMFRCIKLALQVVMMCLLMIIDLFIITEIR